MNDQKQNNSIFYISGVSNASTFKDKIYAKVPCSQDLIDCLTDNSDKNDLYIRISARNQNPEVVRWSVVGFPKEAK